MRPRTADGAQAERQQPRSEPLAHGAQFGLREVRKEGVRHRARQRRKARPATQPGFEQKNREEQDFHNGTNGTRVLTTYVLTAPEPMVSSRAINTVRTYSSTMVPGTVHVYVPWYVLEYVPWYVPGTVRTRTYTQVQRGH